MRGRLLMTAVTKFLAGIALVGLLLFFPAGSLRYWNAWLFIGVLFVPMFFVGSVLLLKSPELLEKRLKSKETERAQKWVIGFSALLFVAGFVVAGLNFRYAWLRLPDWVSIAAAVVFFLTYGLYAEVTRENAYLSRTVEVQKAQTVVDTGLYGLVRHPLYLVTILMFLSIPLILGSLYAFLVFLPYPLLLVKRIKNEESLLLRELEGYAEYTKKVRYRLVPYLW